MYSLGHVAVHEDEVYPPELPLFHVSRAQLVSELGNFLHGVEEHVRTEPRWMMDRSGKQLGLGQKEERENFQKISWRAVHQRFMKTRDWTEQLLLLAELVNPLKHHSWGAFPRVEGSWAHDYCTSSWTERTIFFFFLYILMLLISMLRSSGFLHLIFL